MKIFAFIILLMTVSKSVYAQESLCKELYTKAMSEFMLSDDNESLQEVLILFDSIQQMNCDSQIKDQSRYRQGSILIDLNRNKEALKKLKPSKIESSNDFFLAYFYHERAIAYFNLDKHCKEIKELNRAVSYDPDNIDFLYNRALAYTERKKYKKAIIDLSKCDLSDPDSKVLASLVNYKLERFESSLNYINELLEGQNLSSHNQVLLINLIELIRQKLENLTDEDKINIMNTEFKNVDVRIRNDYKRLKKKV